MARGKKRQRGAPQSMRFALGAMTVAMVAIVLHNGDESEPPRDPWPCADSATDCAARVAGQPCNRPSLLRECAATCGLCSPACERTNATPALGPGGVQAVAARALSMEWLSPSLLHEDPPIVQLDRFLTDDEADAIASMCKDEFSRSLAGDSVSDVRTSNQCWCMDDGCTRHPAVERVLQRAHNVTMTSSLTSEYMQIIKYERGQFYRTHHDQNTAAEAPQGPRVFTLFFYLNTPGEGGATAFTDLGISVTPRKGRAVLWPSVLDGDPERADMRTHHEARSAGDTKMGANIWFHLYDWKTPSRRGCSLLHHNSFAPDEQPEA
tara:strand:- start:1464 stop:2429 length:966 start_codon:yes stop_codon:yes gene_type:complete